MASSDAEDKLGLSEEEEVSQLSFLNTWTFLNKSYANFQEWATIMSSIFLQLDDSKVNSEEDQNDDSDYNTSKKRKRGM